MPRGVTPGVPFPSNPYRGHVCVGDDCEGCSCESSWGEGWVAADSWWRSRLVSDETLAARLEAAAVARAGGEFAWAGMSGAVRRMHREQAGRILAAADGVVPPAPAWALEIIAQGAVEAVMHGVATARALLPVAGGSGGRSAPGNFRAANLPAEMEAKLARAEGQVRAMREDASRALGNAMRERDEAWLDAGTARAEERARIVKALREAAHGGNRGQPGSFWVGWRAAARAIEEGWAEKPETDT